MSWRNPVTFFVNSVGMICPCRPTGHLKFCGTIRRPNILQWNRNCFWRHLLRRCSILVDNRCQTMKLSMKGPKSCGHHLCDVTKNIFFCEELNGNESGVLDPQFPILAKVSSLLKVLQLGGSYELVERLWTQFFLIASCINIKVCWSHNEVLVSIRICSV